MQKHLQTVDQEAADISDNEKRKLSYMEYGFKAVSLYGYLDYYYKNENNPGLQESFEEYYELECSDAESKGYLYDFWLLREIMMFIRKERRLAFVGGNAAYAFLSYIMKIADYVDPYYHDVCFPGMLYGIKGERRPISPLVIPEDMVQDIEMFLEKTYGGENIEHDENAYRITLQGEEGEEYQVYLYLIIDYSLSFVERLVREDLEGTEIDIADKYWAYIFGRIDPAFTLTDEMRSCLESAELAEVVSDCIQLSDEIDEYIIRNTDEFLATFLDGTIDGLIKAVSSIKGSNIWDGTDECAAAVGIFCRDDIYDRCMEYLHDGEMAFAVMENVRKGKGLTATYSTILTEAEASDQFVMVLNKITFVMSERAVLPYVQIILRLTLEKKRNRDHYLEEFREVLKKKENSGS